MDPSGQIDLDHKKLVCSSKDVHKLLSPSGCQLNVVSDKVYKLSEDPSGDEASSDSELEGDDVFDTELKADREYQQRHAREERMRKEFISLILNANRDPIKPGTRSRFREYQEENVHEGEFECDIRNLELSYIGIHRQYEDMGNYEDYMSKHHFREVSLGRVYKLKRIPSVQLPVTDEVLVIYNCALWTEGSKEPFDSTWLRRTTISTHLATDSILPGLHELLLSCKQGELCEAFIRPEAAFGRLGVQPRIAANATIFCLLEVVKVVTKDKYDRLVPGAGQEQAGLTFDEIYEASDEARCRGNYYFEQKLYRTALQRYKSAIRMLECVAYRDAQDESRANELLVKLYNNCARTANAQKTPLLALAACKQARMINDRDPKTHWHRMTAWSLKGHNGRALGVARRAMELFHGDTKILRTFQREVEDLKVKIKREQEDRDDLYRLMSRAILTRA